MLRLFLYILFLCIEVRELSATERFDIKYTVEIQGLNSKQKFILDHLSDEKLIKNRRGVANNIYALKDRVEKFRKKLESKFVEFGYYDVDIKYGLDNVKDYVQVRINIATGKPYKISAINLSVKDQPNSEEIMKLISNRGFFSKSIGKTASVSNILNISRWVARALNKRGYPFAQVISKNVVVDKNNASAIVAIELTLGQKLVFGKTDIRGLKNIKPEFVQNRICWQGNDVYDIRSVEMTNYLLSNSQIFSSVNMHINDEAIKNNSAPMIIELEEDKPRSLEISLMYSTAKSYNFQKISQSQKKLRSFTGSLAWTHHNFLGGGEELKFKASGSPFSIKSSDSPRDYELLTEFSKPDCFMNMDSVTSYLLYDRVNKNAYYKLGKSFGVLWKSGFFLPDFKIQIGGYFEDNLVNGPESSFEKYNAICTPIIFTYDNRNSILNPTNGYKLSLRIDSVYLMGRKLLNVLNLYGSRVYSVNDSRNTLIAVWASVSKIITGNDSTIPLDKRLYAGGMSSVRGYATQMAGPLHKTKAQNGQMQDTKFPVGGSTCLECGLELRKKVYKEIGAVAFIETANIKRKDGLNSSKWFSGYGFGLRYNTVIGPIRLDIAFPLKRRKNIDSKVQFYLSFGQAF